MQIKTRLRETIWKSARSFLRTLDVAERRYIVESVDSLPDVAHDCGQRLHLKRQTRDRAVRGLITFTREMFAIETVEAVAFVARYGAQLLVNVTAVVFIPSEEGNEGHARAGDAVEEAHTGLTKQLKPGLSSGLGFVHTELHGLAQQEAVLMKEWTQDVATDLLAFVEFRRA